MPFWHSRSSEPSLHEDARIEGKKKKKKPNRKDRGDKRRVSRATTGSAKRIVEKMMTDVELRPFLKH